MYQRGLTALQKMKPGSLGGQSRVATPYNAIIRTVSGAAAATTPVEEPPVTCGQNLVATIPIDLSSSWGNYYFSVEQSRIVYWINDLDSPGYEDETVIFADLTTGTVLATEPGIGGIYDSAGNRFSWRYNGVGVGVLDVYKNGDLILPSLGNIGQPGISVAYDGATTLYLSIRESVGLGPWSVHAINTATGALRWSYNYPADPIIHLAAPTTNGIVYAIVVDTDTGSYYRMATLSPSGIAFSEFPEVEGQPFMPSFAYGAYSLGSVGGLTNYVWDGGSTFIDVSDCVFSLPVVLDPFTYIFQSENHPPSERWRVAVWNGSLEEGQVWDFTLPI